MHGDGMRSRHWHSAIRSSTSHLQRAPKTIEARTLCEPPDDPFTFLLDLKRDPLIGY